MTKLTGNVRGDACTFRIISRLFLLRKRNVSNEFCRENQTHVLCSVAFSPKLAEFIR